MRGWFGMADSVAEAVNAGKPVVALESTLLAHGLPAPKNLALARRVEAVVRAAGATPATIAVLDGVARIGLSSAQLERLCDPDQQMAKLSWRDLGPAVGLGRSGATTVASTAKLAELAGIEMFATGGVGGVHRGATETWDVSADLGVLANCGVVVVSSGVKSALDIPATLEVLETWSVPVLAFGTDEFPAFYRRSCAIPAPWRVDSADHAAAVWRAHQETGSRCGLLLANPIPHRFEMDQRLHDRLLAEGLTKVREQGVRGKDVTPVLLEHFHQASAGVSVIANEELVVANAALAAECAVALANAR